MKKENFDYFELWDTYLKDINTNISNIYISLTEALGEECHKVREDCYSYFEKLDEEVKNKYGYDDFFDFITYSKNDFFNVTVEIIDVLGISNPISKEYQSLLSSFMELLLNVLTLNNIYDIYDTYDYNLGGI